MRSSRSSRTSRTKNKITSGFKGIPGPSQTQQAEASRGNANRYPQGRDQAPSKAAWNQEVSRRQSYESGMKPKISMGGVNLKPEEFDQLMDAKRYNYMPTDPKLQKLHVENQTALQDKRLREKVTAQDTETKKTSAIQAELNKPEDIGLSDEMQPVDSNINIDPEVLKMQREGAVPNLIDQFRNPEQNQEMINNLKELYGSLPKRILTRLASGRLGSAVSTLVGGLFSAEETYISNKVEDQEDNVDLAKNRITDIVKLAKAGVLDASDVRDAWEKSVADLAQVESNVQRLSQIDPTYFDSKGKKLKLELEQIRNYLEMSRQELNLALQQGGVNQMMIPDGI